jgi:hypothetical protein
MPDDRRRIPAALHLFAAGTSARHRRRRLAFLAVYVAAAVALLWPVYPRFAAAFPLVLGLPLSLFWILAVLLVVFAALLGLYLGERRDGEVD